MYTIDAEIYLYLQSEDVHSVLLSADKLLQHPKEIHV